MSGYQIDQVRKSLERARATVWAAWRKKQVIEPTTPPIELEELSVDQQLAGAEDRIGARELVRLTEIEAALERIERGSYGSCEVCGEPIADRRLEAIPETRLCGDCAEYREVSRRWP